MLILAYHVYPDPAVGAKRVSELANHLARAGWHVDVVCSELKAADRSRVLDSRIRRHGIVRPLSIGLRLGRGLRAMRGSAGRDSVKEHPASGASPAAPGDSGQTHRLQGLESLYHRIVGLVDGFKLWSTIAAVRAMRLHPRPDVVVTSGPPWSPVVVASLIARFRRIPLVADFRDPWVWESRRDGDRVSRIQHRITRQLERLVLRWASAVTVTTGRFQQAMVGHHPTVSDKTFLLRNGFDPDMLITEPAPRGRLALLYAGTIYMNRNPVPLFDGLAALLSDPGVERAKVRLKLVGNCRRWREHSVSDLARDRGLGDVVEVCGSVSAAEVRNLTLHANVIVNFAQGQPEQVPAKLYEQIASKRYGLLFAEQDSESAMLIEDCPRIRRVDDDGAQILRELRRLYASLVSERVNPDQDGNGTDAHRRDAVNEAYAGLLDRVIHQ